MIKLQNKLLVMDYAPEQKAVTQGITIGIPRTLEFWNSLPFWKSLYTSLGFKVVVSAPSSYKLFESGLQSIPSDTVCFPAKLVHGHVQDLISRKVDRIFNPVLTRIPKENEKAEDSCNCLVVQGYSMVVDESDTPEAKNGIKYDRPVFHFDTRKLMDKQICEYMKITFGIDFNTTRSALEEAHSIQEDYSDRMQRKGREVIKSLEGKDDFAVVLAGRPYHNDLLVNHGIADHFKKMGIPVLNLESIAEIHDQSFDHVRFDSLIAFHGRMYSAASFVAEHPNLELVQIVSFGCGHDAIISDEMARILNDRAGKQMLVLKLDEGENQGPLNIRIKSFIETVKASRRLKKDNPVELKEYCKPYEVKFEKEDKRRTVLIPTLSPAFAKYSAKVLEAEGYKAVPAMLADREAIALGKKYVHNDICYPAQINVGELLKTIRDGNYKSTDVAIGLAKNCEACRAGHYAGLARKALDEAGYADVPILTTGKDTKDMHPGFKVTLKFQMNMLWSITITDVLEEIRRKIRPYEVNAGESDELFELYTDFIYDNICSSRKKALKYFEQAIEAFNNVECDRTIRKPRVGIIGEILMNFHPESNANVERYLEANGMETVFPAMHDFFRQSVVIKKEKGRRGHTSNAFMDYCLNGLTDYVYGSVHKKVDEYYRKFKFYDGYGDVKNLAENTSDMMDMTYRGGESWMMPGEVIELAKKGVNSFVYVQPFGCMPNHITGRGMIKTVKKKFPHIQIIALDYDPDTALANIENRLQMLIISARELEKKSADRNRDRIEALAVRD